MLVIIFQNIILIFYAHLKATQQTWNCPFRGQIFLHRALPLEIFEKFQP